MNSSKTTRQSARRSTQAGVSEASYSQPAQSRVLWKSDPTKKLVQGGDGLEQELMAYVITALNDDGILATNLVILGKDQQPLSVTGLTWPGTVDPILVFITHSLLRAMKNVDTGGDILRIASAAAAEECGVHIGTAIHFRQADAPGYMIERLGEEAYRSDVGTLPGDIPSVLKSLRDWGLEVSTETITSAIIAGRLAMTDELKRLGVKSPEERQARDNARREILDPLRPLIMQAGEGAIPADSYTMQIIECDILRLATHGYADRDLLLGYAFSRNRRLNERPVFVAGLASIMVLHGADPDAYPPRLAAKIVRRVLPDARDEQTLRQLIAGIEADLDNGQLEVKRNDL